jgi:hypothetical protein
VNAHPVIVLLTDADVMRDAVDFHVVTIKIYDIAQPVQGVF